MLKLYLKNILGKRTKGKRICFSVDDYGNVMLASKTARENLRRQGLDIDHSRFSMYDTLETSDDMNALYEVLSSVKDKNNKPACFTAFTMSANIDFDKVEGSNFTEYIYEDVKTTFEKQGKKTWRAWQEGISNEMFWPEFHGREHLNLRVFNYWLDKKEAQFIAALKERSYVSISSMANSRIGYTEAFSIDQIIEVENHKDIIKDGLHLFEHLHGRKATHFNAPGAREHISLAQFIASCEIKMIDTDLVRKDINHLGKVGHQIHTMGSQDYDMTRIYRNAVFEPSLSDNCVETCLKQIDIAFKCGKPANVSSHRVNFVGGIDVSVRDNGLKKLSILLKEIVKRWPDVEFVKSKDLYLS
jgi:hypothetical protein